MPDPIINILLVDDRPEGLLTLEAVIGSPEYNLVKASSGQNALSYLKEFEFAMILLDVQMPEMDGFETATRVKQNPSWQDIPILFVTAIHKDTPYIYQGYEVGAVDYIFKPFDPFILKSKVAVFAELHRKNLRIRQAQDELRHKEEELYQARKLEVIGRLAGGVAHDFNNIITGILGVSEELRDMFDLNDHRRKDLEEIIQASHRAFSLTRQLLAYARRQVISPERLDLNRIVIDMRAMISRLIGEDIQLEIDLTQPLDAINADRGYLEQVLINLVLNSRDAMAEGGTITLRTRNMFLSNGDLQQRKLQLAPGAYVQFSVCDTGSGMGPDVLEHVFEPFFTTKEKGKGTGLGLATVYGIVKQNGGDIAVQSKTNSGTQMEIYFPAMTPQTAAKPHDQEPELLEQGSETILVVEDEHLVRRVVTSQLRKFGYTVLEASNGSEALALCERRRGAIHLLITDVVMPKMNGRQLATLVTARYPGIAVLYMSGYTQEVIARRGILEPGIAFIEKSEISSQLGAKVKEILKPPTPPRPAVDDTPLSASHP